jgi:hypothetical protein
MQMGNVADFGHNRGARPIFARAPKGCVLLPYWEGKAASSVTVIGSPACTVILYCEKIGFFCLKILKKNAATVYGREVRVPPAGVFEDKRNGGCLRNA